MKITYTIDSDSQILQCEDDITEDDKGTAVLIYTEIRDDGSTENFYDIGAIDEVRLHLGKLALNLFTEAIT